MSADHTIQIVEQLRVDALYGKKKHFNAADRKERYNTYIGIFLIVANAVIASNLVYMFISEIRTFGVIIGTCGLIATVLAVVQAFFNYSRTAEQHRMVSDKIPAYRQRVLQNKSILPGWGIVSRRAQRAAR